MKNLSRVGQLIKESTTSISAVDGRPALLALTRATTKLIYQDLVAIQPTTQSVAALYGVKYLNPNDKLSFVTGATYSGEFGTKERETLTEITMMTLSGKVKGDYFLYDDVVFKVLIDDPFAGTTETELSYVISEAVAAATIRLVPDSAPTEQFERGDVEISEAGFEISKWQAKARTRKLKTTLTVELAQDLEANGFKTPEMIDDLLATQMAEEINKDVMQSLITVSRRFNVQGVSNKGVLDLSATGSSVEQARTAYRFICEMNASIQKATSYSATYVVASSRVAALLASTGWLEIKDNQPESAFGILMNGLVLYCDNNSPVEYVIVGVKDYYGPEEMIGSLFYAPYISKDADITDPVDHVGAYTILNDSSSLQPSVALMIRYALCVNPYTMGISDEDARVIDAADMDNFSGKSEMSVLLGFKLPKLV